MAALKKKRRKGVKYKTGEKNKPTKCTN